jgi:deoxyribose-phosphate aldolase
MPLVLLSELESPFMADVWCEALERAGIPHLLRTYQDTAYGGLYVSQRGYASLYVEEKWREKAEQVDQDLRASTSPVPFDALSLARKLDANFLDPKAGEPELDFFVEQVVEMSVAALCVHPWLVKKAAPLLAGSKVALCGLIDHPFGAATTRSKCEHARELVSAGAVELEMVLNRGLALGGRLDEAVEEVRAVAEAAAGAPLKVTLEMGELGEELSREAARALAESQAASYLKTGSGFFGQARLEDVELLREAVGGAVGIKAEGGVTGVNSLLEFCGAGAGRIGLNQVEQLYAEALNRWPNQD